MLLLYREDEKWRAIRERSVAEMKSGESETIEIPAVDAHGEYDDDLVLVVDRDGLPPGSNPRIGEHFRLPHTGSGSLFIGITEVTDSTVTLDANHA